MDLGKGSTKHFADRRAAVVSKTPQKCSAVSCNGPMLALQKDWERFTAKTQMDDSCIVWTGCRHPAGYGHFKFRGKVIRSHRFCYEYFHGAIPEGFYVRHLCDNPPCVNPFHLEIGTSAENSRDVPKEKRRQAAIDHWMKKSSDYRVAHAKRAQAARKPESYRAAAIKREAAYTPEQRRARMLKAAETRRRTSQ